MTVPFFKKYYQQQAALQKQLVKKAQDDPLGFFLCARVQLPRFNLACFFYYSANNVVSSVSNPGVGSTEHLLYASDLAHQAEFYLTEEARCRGLGQEQSSAGPSLSPYQHPQTSSPTKRQWTRMGNSWASQRWMAWMRVFSVPASIYKPEIQEIPPKLRQNWPKRCPSQIYARLVFDHYQSRNSKLDVSFWTNCRPEM